jgi:hypothetical protein
VPTSSDVRAVRVVGDPQNGLAIEVTLSPRRSRELFNYTAAHLGEELAIVLDGKVIWTPVVTVPTSYLMLQPKVGYASAPPSLRVSVVVRSQARPDARRPMLQAARPSVRMG